MTVDSNGFYHKIIFVGAAFNAIPAGPPFGSLSFDRPPIPARQLPEGLERALQLTVPERDSGSSRPRMLEMLDISRSLSDFISDRRRWSSKLRRRQAFFALPAALRRGVFDSHRRWSLISRVRWSIFLLIMDTLSSREMIESAICSMVCMAVHLLG
jgi:hypothetical protein